MCYPWECSSCAYLEGTVTHLWKVALTYTSSPLQQLEECLAVLISLSATAPSLLHWALLLSFQPFKTKFYCPLLLLLKHGKTLKQSPWQSEMCSLDLDGADTWLWLYPAEEGSKVCACSCWKMWVKNCWFLPPFTTMHGATGKPLCSVLPQHLLFWRCSPGADSIWCEV